MKNFKSWRDSREVKLAPLTGFFGTNSSGKSSLLQMLLLLKQTVERADAEETIFFGDENSLVNLGSFREVIHGHESGTELYLGIIGKLSHSSLNFFKTPFQTMHFAFDTTIRENEESLIIEQFRYTSMSSNIKIVWENDKFFNRNQHPIPLYIQNCYGLPSSENSDIPEVLIEFSSAFENLFAHVYYLGPTRAHPQRYYHWERTHPKEIDMWGDKAIDALLSASVRQLTTTHNGKGVPIEEQISKWLQKLDLAHSFSLVPIGDLDDNNYEIRIRKTPNSAQVTLSDLGHGVGDLFPLLVHCCYVPEGSTLILEQPGIHLHPKAQADLADLLIEVITGRNLQILIESHSEHLLNRLQRRVAEEKIAADETALYFCRNEAGVSTIERLEMDEFGNIANWPENFFGDEMGDLFAMTEAQRERQKIATGLIEGPAVAPSKG